MNKVRLYQKSLTTPQNFVNKKTGRHSSVAERFLGKEEVESSILSDGTKTLLSFSKDVMFKQRHT